MRRKGTLFAELWRNLSIVWLRRAKLNLRPGYTRPEKRDVIRTFITMATALENKWLVRIILKGATQIALRGGTKPAADLAVRDTPVRAVLRRQQARRLGEHHPESLSPGCLGAVQRVLRPAKGVP